MRDDDRLSLASGIGRADARQPPGNVEVEMALLGAVLVDNRVYDEVAEIVTADHFLLPVHGMIWRAIAGMIERGEQASASNLHHVVAADPLYESHGQPRYLADLAATTLSTVEADSYARTIRSLYIARETIGIAEQTIVAMRDGGADDSVEDRIAATTAALDALATRQDRTGWVAMDQAVHSAIVASEAAYRRGDGLVGASTGLAAIDDATGGLVPGDIIIIAGRPGMGKTSLADQIAEHIARDRQQPVAFFSLEMGAPQLGQRFLARKAGADLSKVRRGKVHAAELEKLILVGRNVGKLPMFIDPTPALTLQAVRSRARLLHRKQGQLGAVVVDHIGLMRPSNQRLQRHEHLGEITSGLKALGKELECPVLALCQLSRAVEGREDKRPGLSDLRESGRIEEDADGVWLLYRESYYLERAKKDPGDKGFEDWDRRLYQTRNLCEVILAKQRQGPACNVTLKFDPATTTFSDRLAGGQQHDFAMEGQWS